MTDASKKKGPERNQAKPGLLSSNHLQGANGLIANGVVKTFSPKTSPQILSEMLNATEPTGF